MYVPPEAIDWVEGELQELDHPVLQLVPPELDIIINQAYEAIGSPNLRRDNLWDVFTRLRNRLQLHDDLSIPVTNCDDPPDELDEQQVALDRLRPLVDVNGDSNFPRYLGGVNNGRGLGECNPWNVFLPLLSVLDSEQIAAMDPVDREDFPIPNSLRLQDTVNETQALLEIAQGGNGRLEMDFSDDEFYNDEVEVDLGPTPDAW